MQQVHEELIKQNITLATAESCTGGALAAAFVANPGASHYFLGGIVAYSNSIKEKLLDVDPKVLEEHGAVSQEVCEQMALNVCQKLGASLGIAVSGILGPTGGTPKTPVGTVCSSIAHNGQIVLSWTMQLQGDRHDLLQKVIKEISAKLYIYLIEQ